MKSSSQTVINLPVDRIDLPAWLAKLSDRDYQACSPAHRAAGIFYENGVFGSINVENVGGHLLVHHYLAEDASAQRITMRSRNTRAYVLHIAPATIEVIWKLEVEPRDSGTRCFVARSKRTYRRSWLSWRHLRCCLFSCAGMCRARRRNSPPTSPAKSRKGGSDVRRSD